MRPAGTKVKHIKSEALNRAMLSPEHERWAFAAKVMDMHGDDIGIFIAERIRSLAENADHDGVRFWIDISEKVLQLAGPDEGAWTQ